MEDVKKADLRKAYVLRDNQKVKVDFSRLFVAGDAKDHHDQTERRHLRPRAPKKT